jgi:MarR family transcriptional regulator, organic hydroperoxide resistance regulator
MNSELDNIAEQMAELTFQMEKACQEKEQFFASRFSLTPAEFRCLRYLHSFGSLSTKDLAKLMNLSPGRITHIITALEDKDYINRNFDPSDRRSIKVNLNSHSIELVREINQQHIEMHKQLLTNIPIERSNQILNALKDMIRAIQLWVDTRSKEN